MPAMRERSGVEIAELLTTGLQNDGMTMQIVCPPPNLQPDEPDHHCECPFCAQRAIELQQLQEQLHFQTQETEELRSAIQLTSDLNMVTPFITRYYTEVFRQVKSLFEEQYEDRRTSFPYNTWVELFSAASRETARFDEFDSDQKPLNDAILTVMGRMGGLREEHWDALQSVRKERNMYGHPELDETKVAEAIELRWRDHPAYSALSGMLGYLSQRPRHRRKMFTGFNNNRHGNWRTNNR